MYFENKIMKSETKRKSPVSGIVWSKLSPTLGGSLVKEV